MPREVREQHEKKLYYSELSVVALFVLSHGPLHFLSRVIRKALSYSADFFLFSTVIGILDKNTIYVQIGPDDFNLSFHFHITRSLKTRSLQHKLCFKDCKDKKKCIRMSPLESRNKGRLHCQNKKIYKTRTIVLVYKKLKIFVVQ